MKCDSISVFCAEEYEDYDEEEGEERKGRRKKGAKKGQDLGAVSVGCARVRLLPNLRSS